MFNSGLLFCAHPELDLKPCRRGKVWIVFFPARPGEATWEKGIRYPQLSQLWDGTLLQPSWGVPLPQASVCHTLRWYQWSIKSTSITPSYLVWYLIFWSCLIHSQLPSFQPFHLPLPRPPHQLDSAAGGGASSSGRKKDVFTANICFPKLLASPRWKEEAKSGLVNPTTSDLSL